MDIVECVLKDTVFFHVHGFKKKQNKKNKTKQNQETLLLRFFFRLFIQCFLYNFGFHSVFRSLTHSAMFTLRIHVLT